ncbi:MAG: hypothetical protein JST40_10195 [Armatimonadetes bacterium]|nr:hypothetical protein [Armatimonadota bacterium]
MAKTLTFLGVGILLGLVGASVVVRVREEMRDRYDPESLSDRIQDQLRELESKNGATSVARK